MSYSDSVAKQNDTFHPAVFLVCRVISMNEFQNDEIQRSAHV